MKQRINQILANAAEETYKKHPDLSNSGSRRFLTLNAFNLMESQASIVNDRQPEKVELRPSAHLEHILGSRQLMPSRMEHIDRTREAAKKSARFMPNSDNKS